MSYPFIQGSRPIPRYPSVGLSPQQPMQQEPLPEQPLSLQQLRQHPQQHLQQHHLQQQQPRQSHTEDFFRTAFPQPRPRPQLRPPPLPPQTNFQTVWPPDAACVGGDEYLSCRVASLEEELRQRQQRDHKYDNELLKLRVQELEAAVMNIKASLAEYMQQLQTVPPPAPSAGGGEVTD